MKNILLKASALVFGVTLCFVFANVVLASNYSVSYDSTKDKVRKAGDKYTLNFAPVKVQTDDKTIKKLQYKVTCEGQATGLKCGKSFKTSIGKDGKKTILSLQQFKLKDLETDEITIEVKFLNSSGTTVETKSVTVSAIDEEDQENEPTLENTCPLNLTINLTVGSKGTQVTKFQRFLVARDYLDMSTPNTVYGTYGTTTKAATLEFQTDHGLASSTGLVGAKTRALVKTVCAAGE